MIFYKLFVRGEPRRHEEANTAAKRHTTKVPIIKHKLTLGDMATREQSDHMLPTVRNP
ncbi:hypothetical protein TRAPUB_9643 [Trametes pubescens]|uniref:Uncharacterized protein n=1 Tax=Trametes pubescens TaxID=154538 RepID=A0A1M2W1W1_TRAPU|nr:hypothetical protein TRAPUB_9643 [Trametes pubescens]